MVDLTENLEQYVSLLQKCWETMRTSLGQSFEENVHEADECLAVAASYLFSVIVEGETDVHLASRRSPLLESYPYQSARAGIRIVLNCEVEGILGEDGTVAGRWTQTTLGITEVLEFIDLFDFDVRQKSYAYFRGRSQDGRHYLVPRVSGVRLIKCSEFR